MGSSLLSLPHRARNVLLLLTVSVALAAGTWTVEKLAIKHLLDREAISIARNWADYLTQNVGDLAAIAEGQAPSAISIAFLRQAQKVGHVFRYKIFDPDGRLRLVSDELPAHSTSAHDLGKHGIADVPAIVAGQPLVIAKEGKLPAWPAFFSEVYVPVVAAGRVIAILETYVDQTERRENFHTAFAIAAASLSLLTVLAFCVPAVALHQRTKEKQRAEERIRFLAHHDPMTNLPNRAQFVDTLQQKLVTARGRNMLALHYVDLDHFKDVNDTLGHEAGDSLLIATADRLRAASGTDVVVARLGGDEFVLLEPGLESKDAAERTAIRVLEELAKPFQLNGHELAVTASVGIAIAPQDGECSSELLRSADLAMYAAKSAGRNCLRFFVAEMDVALQARLRLEKAIRDATFGDGFELHFQPIVDMPAGVLAGFEALLRLRAVDGGFIPAAIFIPVAEEMGLIGKMGTFVLREACRTATTWPKGLTLAVNLSPAQFTTGGICDTVAAALSETGLEPHRLELEITESLLLAHTAAVMSDLSKLKTLGAAIAIDDFGTGYSSLSYLWRFPFDKLKIDRTFMRAYDTGDKNAETVVKTIVGLARSLNMRVTSEGVENARQVGFVRSVECNQAQGHYFGQPLPATELAAKIINHFHGTLRQEATWNAITPHQAGLRTSGGAQPSPKAPARSPGRW